MKTYTVTLESYEGRCKKVKVLASNQFDAMALATRSGWMAVEAKEAQS